MLCLAFAELVTWSISYQGYMLVPYGGGSDVLLVYVAYPLLYVGWLLVMVGAASLVHGFLFGRDRPSHGDLTYAGVQRQDHQASYPGVEEPTSIASR